MLYIVLFLYSFGEEFLEKHVKNWIEKGYIDEKQAGIILADIKQEKEKSARLAINITLYTIGAILIGIGVISFIAANDWILRLFYSRFAKISAALIVTFGCFALGYRFSFVKAEYKRLGSVLIFLSTILIGGVWALIGQIYNLPSESNCEIFFLWLLSILPVAFLFNKKSINNLSIMLFIAAYFNIPNIYDLEYLAFIVFGLILYNFANIPAIRRNFGDFTPTYKAVSTVVLYFTILIMFCIFENMNILRSLGIVLPLAMLAFALLNFTAEKVKDSVFNVETLILAGISIYGILSSLDISTDTLAIINVIGSNILLASIIMAHYHFGYKAQNTGLVTRANYFTLIYISVLYFKISYHLLDKALFFFLGGVILLSLGIYLEKQKRSLKGGQNNEQ